MKLITNHTGGRLGNQLYFVLQAYCMTKRYNQQFKYVISDTVNPVTNLGEYADKLHIWDYFQETYDHVDVIQPLNSYYQFINRDFTEQELKGFVDDTMIKSEYLKQIVTEQEKIADNSKVLAIHVRNGDYLNIPQFMCFDRIKYLNEAIRTFDEGIKQVHVYSDDIDITEKLYGELLHNRFEMVSFDKHNEPLGTMFRMATYKNKILWNSTFSFWSGFISDSLYDDTKIVVPAQFMNGVSSSLYTPNKWIKI